MGENDPELGVRVFAQIDGVTFNRDIRLRESMTVPIDTLITESIVMKTGDIIVDRRDVGVMNFGEVKDIGRGEGVCFITSIGLRSSRVDLLSAVRLEDLDERTLMSKLLTVRGYIEMATTFEEALEQAIAEKRQQPADQSIGNDRGGDRND
ncbi:MAG: hypothetical protein NC131_11165 [Roseburia sp.]|nr:hypothetical protein [Roseburia sp.]